MTNVIFILDTEIVGSYYHHPNYSVAPYEYNVPVYANASLLDMQHTLIIEAMISESAAPLESGSPILFDYIIYT